MSANTAVIPTNTRTRVVVRASDRLSSVEKGSDAVFRDVCHTTSYVVYTYNTCKKVEYCEFKYI